jgi:RNA polymerase sigma-70 factor (ECF subfamily)
VQERTASPTTESALWAAALEADEHAFAGVFDLHRDRVFRHAFRLAESRSDAEDVVAMAFTDLWRRRDAVRVVDGSVLPWLLVTTTNHARNTGRGGRRYRAMLSGLPHAVEEDAGLVAVHRIEAERRRRALRAALGQLSQTDATLLLLTALEGVPTADAAAVVGVTPAAARTRLTRSRRRLRTLLEELGIGTSEEGQ